MGSLFFLSISPRWFWTCGPVGLDRARPEPGLLSDVGRKAKRCPLQSVIIGFFNYANQMYINYYNIRVTSMTYSLKKELALLFLSLSYVVVNLYATFSFQIISLVSLYA